MKTAWMVLGLLGAAGATAHPQDPERPLRVFIRAGAKTHGPGEHDHPRFLEEWKELLRARGAETQGALRFPTAAELGKADVLILYAPEGATMNPEERSLLDGFLKRGGGLVVLHDAVCGNDPQWFKTVAGGAWEHGRSKYHHGKVGLYLQDYPHEITRGAANFFLDDEIYWDLHLAPEAKVLAVAFRTAHEITPQMWVYERDGYRAFVSLQGHRHASFSLPHYRALLLRGIAWAGKRPVDLLVRPEELSALRYPEGGPVAPARAAEKLKVEESFELSLVLAEPDIVKPISIGWDPRGRLWVLQTPQYPLKADVWKARPRDSLVHFEDRDGDGRFDRRTVFYDELDLPTSFVFHRDGVIVTQAPDILFLRDTDGDGVADRREVLYTGFGFGDTHATTSNLRWGPDGWVYATQGYSGGGSRHVRNAEGKDFGHIGNGLFRFRPDGSAIEMVSSYSANTWGLDVTWDHEIFFTMANESHLRHVVLPEAVLARARVGQASSWKFIADHRDSNPLIRDRLHPYQQIDCVGGFTAAAGSTVYDGGAWPDEYRSVHFVTECTVNLVHQDRLVPEGVTFRATKVRDEEFMAGTDLWFRPIDTQVGPDGALYVVDFYNQAVVHNDTRGPRHGPYNAAIRPDRDRLHGRLWRVQHRQARTLPAADFSSPEGLVRALEHPNRWVRLTAQRLLCEQGRGAEEVRALLRRSPSAAARVLCLWTLERLGGLKDEDLAAAFRDPEAGVRKNAARIAGLGARAAGGLSELLKDADPRVRLEALAVLSSGPVSDEAVRAVAALYGFLGDDWSRSAALAVLAARPAEGAAAALEAGVPAAAEELAGLVGTRQDAAAAAEIVALMGARPAGERAAQAAVLGRLARTLRSETALPLSAEVRRALEALLASGDPEVTAAAVSLAARAGADDSLARALEPAVRAMSAAVLDASRPDEARARQLSLLASVPAARAAAREAAGRLLEPSSSTDLQRAAIEALGSMPEISSADVLLGAWTRLAASAREQILAQLLKRPEWTGRLLDALEQGKIRPNDLGPTALFRIRNHPDPATARRAARVVEALVGGQAKAKDQIVAALLPEVLKPGDAARGKALFAENCLKCHAYKGEGRNVAPDLTGMGVHGREELLVHIVDPNRTVEGNYVSFNVRTRTGEVFNGIVVREGRESVVLKNSEGEREIRRADIDAMASTGLSLMPEGLESLGAAALRDILTYLTADAGGFRIVDLQPAFTASTVRGLYDPRREPHNLRLRKFGVVSVEGIPFQLVDPARSLNGNNAIVLKGGAAADWASKTRMPQRVEVPLGFAFRKLHVLGGIGAWAAAEPRRGQPAARVVFHYADGAREERILYDGVEFSDWIRRIDVPGSRYAEGLVEPGTRGQVRWFTLEPRRAGVPVQLLVLESFDNHIAPTFLAMTAEVGEAKDRAPRGEGRAKGVLLVGGGSSHDFDRWFRDGDARLLGAEYTADPARIAPALPGLSVLILANNQPLADPATRKAIFEFVDSGGGLLLVHAATWYNWKDWPEYNRDLVGGGSRGHDRLQEFEVTVAEEGHPVMSGVPRTFRIRDELYRFEGDPAGPGIRVLARGTSPESGREYPVVWTVERPRGRIVCVTLGHDGGAHEHGAYRAILRNAVSWLGEGR
jgi:putative membrane-bound dehydrogenase-like protein